jgi:hypothetical protein
MSTGRLTTAEDITKLTSKSGERIGEPFVGRFDNQDQALSWFSEAADAPIVGTVSKLHELVPGRSYAMTLNLDPRSGANALHMVFAHRFRDGGTFVYDGQSGLKLSNHSLFYGKLTSTFHELGLPDQR